MYQCILVGIGGFIGTVCRYLIGLIPIKPENGFPIKTLAINVLGAFFISLITALTAKSNLVNSQITTMLKVGICGGFTTFSTFAYESAELMKNGNILTALCYILASVLLGILAIYAGSFIVE